MRFRRCSTNTELDLTNSKDIGTIRTLSLNIKVRFVPAEPSQNEKAPDLRVLAGNNVEIGAAWKRTSVHPCSDHASSRLRLILFQSFRSHDGSVVKRYGVAVPGENAERSPSRALFDRNALCITCSLKAQTRAGVLSRYGVFRRR